MQKKTTLLIASLLACTVFAAGASARDLVIVSNGGTFQEAQSNAIFKPFEKKTGIKVVEDTWDNGIGVIRTKVEGGDSGWDIVNAESEELEIACQEGLILPLDIDKLGGKDNYVSGAVHKCGIGAAIYNHVLAYDKTRVSAVPSWADFFDLKKYPGKRALRASPKTNLEFALIADGVPLADVYKVLSTPEGVDRAFAKLDTIKSSLVFWTAGGQPMQLLASGEVVMTSSFNGRVTNAINKDHKPFGIVWDKSLQTADSWVILKTSPNVDKAYELLKFAGEAEPQSHLPEVQPIGITSAKAMTMVKPELLADLPTAPENAKDVLQIDDAFWIDNIDALTARWAEWSAQ
ncbi:ABC transporter substrate-binding protein [Mesorhizobium sp. CU2]|uniref:ABC transporter substrate-binding protein n=1 Tax=unclassified Mesorhizobium TaxID=325217 RepID=UPI00112BBCE3|nr:MULTISPECIES: ABC transporter substrate-binding protein [unclassified Mesorhizobium]TPN85599.1 ABC transporter substrate-binding protein [Mesorhizobium sp. CU3]TPO10277.1 ABC transporter substrate-binding protein [Mesorhizobium sp. CU2]